MPPGVCAIIRDATSIEAGEVQFVCALSSEGLLAPLVLDRPINGDTFVAWVEQMLVPELKKGDIAVMGKLSSHKVAGVKPAIEGAVATLRYLPPQSTELKAVRR